MSKEIYVLDFNIKNPIFARNFSVNLAKINYPLFENTPIMTKNYDIIKSLYVQDTENISNVIEIINCLFNFYIENVREKSVDNSSLVLIINQFSNWDKNSDIFNFFIIKNYIKNSPNSHIFYFKNKYKKTENDDKNTYKNDRNPIEKYIFSNEINHSFLSNLYYINNNNNNNNNNNSTISNIITTCFPYEQNTDTLSNLSLYDKKKRDEIYSVKSRFFNARITKIHMKNVCFSYEKIVSKFVLFNGLIGKFVVLLQGKGKNKGEILTLVPDGIYEYLGIGKILNITEDSVQLLTDICTAILEKEIIIMFDKRLESVLKMKKQEKNIRFLEQVKFDILKDEDNDDDNN